MALRFRYRSIERPEPLGPKALPVIPITYLGKGGESFESAPILDSGADFSVIFKEHAEILGIDLSKCEQTECQGIGGKVKAWKTKIPVRLKGKGEHRALRQRLSSAGIMHNYATFGTEANETLKTKVLCENGFRLCSARNCVA